MTYVKPASVLSNMIQTGTDKAKLPALTLLLNGFLGGAILAFATTLAFSASAQTGFSIVGSLLFPTGFAIIILLGLELVTGNFALIPLAALERKVTVIEMLRNFGLVIAGHLIGCFVYAILYVAVITQMGTQTEGMMIDALIQISEGKTLAYKEMGQSGLYLVLIKAVLCNWMVTLGATMAMTSSSTSGKIIAMWLPILIFFAQGFEHAVVNMFVIPAGILLGAEISIADWWLWNQGPVLIGNFVGGVVFTGLFLYYSGRRKSSKAQAQQAEHETTPTFWQNETRI